MDKDHVFPPRDLPGRAEEWGRTLETGYRELAGGQTALSQSLQGLNRSTAASLQDLSRQVNLLTAMQRRAYAEWTTGLTGVTGFSQFASVDITSPTGRIEVGYGGSLNGGDGYFVYSVDLISPSSTLVSRSDVQANPAQRVAVTGGASFAPSGYRTQPVDVPIDTPVRVFVHGYTSSTFTYYFGASISARVVA